MRSNTAHQKGFTLIELLVSISIVAILSVIGIIIFSGVTAKSRDAQRKNDLRNLSIALELYHRKNNSYPQDITDCDDSALFYTAMVEFLQDGNPKDPKEDSNYCYLSDTPGYKLYTKLENCSDPDVIPGSCPADKPWNFGIDHNGNPLKTAPPSAT